MDISKVIKEDGITFKLFGNLDSTIAPAFEAELISGLDSLKDVTVDFKGVKYISSAGMRVLLIGDKTAKAKGGKLVITNVSSFVMEIFEVTGFSNILNFG